MERRTLCCIASPGRGAAMENKYYVVEVNATRVQDVNKAVMNDDTDRLGVDDAMSESRPQASPAPTSRPFRLLIYR